MTFYLSNAGEMAPAAPRRARLHERGGPLKKDRGTFVLGRGWTVSAKRKQSIGANSQALRLSLTEVNDLVKLSRYYENSMGFSRYLVRVASGSVMRARFKFVSDESRILEQFASSIRTEMETGDEAEREVQFTPRSLVAFWGRALSSLDSQRSRRKMTAGTLQLREELALKLQNTVGKLHKRSRKLVESEIATRRAPEVTWMLERLQQT